MNQAKPILTLRRITAGTVGLLLTLLFAGGVYAIIGIRHYPPADRALHEVHTFLQGKGYRLLLEGRNDIARTAPPLVLRLLGNPSGISDDLPRLGGVGTPYQYGYVCKYGSSED